MISTNTFTENRRIIVSPALPLYSLEKEIHRGDQAYPAMSAVNAVAHNYVVEKLAKKTVLKGTQQASDCHRADIRFLSG